MVVGQVLALGGVVPHVENAVADEAHGAAREVTGVIANQPRANLITVSDRDPALGLVEPPTRRNFRRTLDSRERNLNSWLTILRQQGRSTDAIVLEIASRMERSPTSAPLSVSYVNALLESGYAPVSAIQAASSVGATPEDIANPQSTWGKFLAGLTDDQRTRLRADRMPFAEFINLWYRNNGENRTEPWFEATFRPFGSSSDVWLNAELVLAFKVANRESDYQAARQMMSTAERTSLDEHGMSREAFQRYLTLASTPATRQVLEARFGTNINAAATKEEKARLDRGEMSPAEFRWISVRNAQRRTPYSGSGTMP